MVQALGEDAGRKVTGSNTQAIGSFMCPDTSRHALCSSNDKLQDLVLRKQSEAHKKGCTKIHYG